MEPILASFHRQFSLIDNRSRELLSKLDENMLFEKPRPRTDGRAMFSCGEYILRSAAMIERTFGGITTRLWDDPFEWTLPEKLSNKAAVLDYLAEVDETRQKGFLFFTSDADLNREIPAPEKFHTIHDILLDSIITASHFQGRAFAVFQMISHKKLPRL